jgi:hypothetical protein
MTMQALLYYPAKKILNSFPWTCSYAIPLAACNASLNVRLLSPNEQIEDRIFGRRPAQCSIKASNKNETSNSVTTYMTLWYVWLLTALTLL